MRFSDFIKNNEESARTLLSSEDSRSFLNKFIQIKKTQNPSYSYAVFARQAGVSKSLPRDVAEGLKRVTEKTLPNFLKAFEIDGLMQEFFTQILKAEKEPECMKLARKVADLYIETYFTKTYTDKNFEDFRSPFLYAASGEVGKGTTLLTMSERTGIPIEKIKDAMPALEKLKLGRYIKDDDKFVPFAPQVHIALNEKGPSHFSTFYKYCLALQREVVLKKFIHPDTLFYNEVFSVHEKDIPKIKEDLKNVIKSFLIKAENPDGDSIAVFNLGLFKQTFKESEMV